jgi:transposase
MSERPRILRSQRKIIGPIEIVNPNAAGVDAGSEEHVVSVPEDRADEPVRTFGTFTEDLNALADWLLECGISTVAIEATGVYWIPLYEILEAKGLNPKLVDSRSIGRRRKKTDVLDCQWLRQLHAYGLLDAAFRPQADILRLRAYNRQKDMLVKCASDHIRHIQKALDLMNVKLHLIVSDVAGVSGLRIIRAIMAGQHAPATLAALRDKGCRASEAEFVKALTGNYREEHLFALRQAVELFDVYQTKFADCDAETARQLATFDRQGDPEKRPAARKRSRRKNQPNYDARTLLYDMVGIDLTAIDGLECSSVLTILSETGTDMSPWNSGKSFASWLALSPNNRITGGKPIRTRERVIRPNRAAQAFRLAAQTLERAQCGLGAFFRRVRARQGRRAAIKATAHKLARIFYSMMKNRTEYLDPGLEYYEQRYRDGILRNLTRNAAKLGFTLVPTQEVH